MKNMLREMDIRMIKCKSIEVKRNDHKNHRSKWPFYRTQNQVASML